ncbi:MAG: AAA family ATPase [Burkholderiales bacterium]|nr:AAA family ATPase [Burkholderiales bacterium]
MKAGDEAIRQWLQAHGLDRYADTFADNDVGFEALARLSDADLKDLGLSLGHRRVLQKAIQRLHRPGMKRGSTLVSAPAGVGEQRQVTVMFCDLVGSTSLVGRIGAEAYHHLLTHDYLPPCCAVINESGYVARIVGDCIVAYFGYPAAREDAAECAIRAGLRIAQTMARVQPASGVNIAVRIALATGMSIVGDLVGVGYSEFDALTGQAPNLAFRMLSIAAPGAVVVADETRRLAGNFFVYADAGSHDFRGFDRPTRVWQVVGETRRPARFDAQHKAQSDCIGRDAELAELHDAWARVQQGACRVVTLVGEAGIGKSRLLRAASDRFSLSVGLAVFMQCSPSQTSTPLHPLVDWLRRDIGVNAPGAADNPVRLRAWLGSDASAQNLALMAEFLSIVLPPADTRPALPPDRKRHLMREIVLRHIEQRCVFGPVLLMVEDAHWMDGATEQFLVELFARMADRPVLALITTRPRRVCGWADAKAASEIHLDPLERADAERLIVTTCRDRRLPPPVIDEILARTDGVPLFIEELTAMILESGPLRSASDGQVMDGPLPALDIPSTLRDSLTARLDRLADIKDIARVASAIGREFTFTLLAQVSEEPAERLVAALDRLVEARLLFQRGEGPQASYVFKHALVQQAAYDSQLRSDRLALHARIVRAIETHQPEMARSEPGLMAHHCQLAGDVDREVDYLRAAGLASTRIVAINEALSYFSRAELAIARLEPNARNLTRHIEIILGMMEVGRFAILPSQLRALSERAREMSLRAGVTCDPAMTAAILFQDARANVYSSRYEQARGIFQVIRQLGRDNGVLAIERKPASAFAMGLCCQGLFGETLEFVNAGNIEYYKESGSFIDYISALGWIGYSSCQAGGGDDGLAFGHLSVHEAEQVQSQIYLAGAYIWRSHAMMAVRRLDEAVSDARLCVSLSTQHAMPYLGWHGLVFLALCLCRSGDLDGATQTLAQARELLSKVEDGQWSLLDYLPAIEAEIACQRGDHASALRWADEAIGVAGPIGGHFAEAMAWRVKAISSLHTGASLEQAQACLDLAMARHERGEAHAERTFTTLVWAHTLHQAGQPQAARQWVDQAKALAGRHGYVLARCEHGAAAVLGGLGDTAA